MTKRLTVYNVKWSGFENSDRQALPSSLVAKDRFNALQVLGETLQETGIRNMPDSVTLTWIESNAASGDSRVLAWRVVGH